MLYLYVILGYVYLFIHRPFEIWPALGDMRVELVYFMLLSAGWLVLGPKRIRLDGLMLAVVGMTFATGVAWVLSPWSDAGQCGRARLRGDDVERAGGPFSAHGLRESDFARGRGSDGGRS